MNFGKCEMPCAPWRKYDLNTDSCVLRCPTHTQHWDDAIKGCVNCPPGYQVDGFNQCILPIPKAPVYNTPAPTCPPGYAKDANGACFSTCPNYATNNAADPLVCDAKCTALNQYWDRTKTTDNGCSTCTLGYLTDANNQCHECDVNADYVPAIYKYGTLGYTPVADTVTRATSMGYTCQATCAAGYLVNTDSNSAGYNTCSVCDSAPNPSLFVVKYALDRKSGSATQGQCLPVCSAPNVLNVDNLDPAHPCNLCVADYTTDILDNNPHKVQENVDPNLRRCMPMKCDTGYIIGADFKCSACDVAGGYTNDLAQVDVGSKSALVKYPSNTQSKCFPKTCPNNTALGPDLTCSICAPGTYAADPKMGCLPANDEITLVSVSGLIAENVTMDCSAEKVYIGKFYLDFTLSFAMSNYNYATVSIDDKDTKTKPKALNPGIGKRGSTVTTEVTFSNVAFTPNSVSKYALNYMISTIKTDAYTIKKGDFAVGYFLVGAGAGGGETRTETREGSCWRDCRDGVGVPAIAPYHDKCCHVGDFDAGAQRCCGKKPNE